ncbi:uncharacterized protein PHALS_11526 [Plasmopara halstedii]|uniref:Uncharacterized protein n=1 Tax=Plasmopara halstedii TaxID=4781 RepID=A0A0P1A5Q0_PLAHL|nr:uncharacterized protein PHALS_11526 [Plasmopara halstedii]CEG35657.1 hypothetical protein PHALS_11526 [Plasmopara halstedii]|eukprot:XP_024572026.1 hypothetical protein PHALS_11526 [Plasmopara halstedii]
MNLPDWISEGFSVLAARRLIARARPEPVRDDSLATLSDALLGVHNVIDWLELSQAAQIRDATVEEMARVLDTQLNLQRLRRDWTAHESRIAILLHVSNINEGVLFLKETRSIPQSC